MPTRPAIIMPVVPFASWADMGRALVVMGPIITDGVRMCQNGLSAEMSTYEANRPPTPAAGRSVAA